jgi:hypothetical protein
VALSRLHLRSIVIRTSLGGQKCQKRPTVVSKETYCSFKRDLLRSEHRHKDVTSEEVKETF